jgi:hypothetical protein
MSVQRLVVAPVIGAAMMMLVSCGGGGGGGSGAKVNVNGTVSGLTGTVVLQDNAGDSVGISTNGTFTFPTTLANGSTYSITVLTQPAGETCSVTNGVGTVSGASISNVCVNCAASAASFATDFSLQENPISECGRWTNGKTAGILWNDIKTLTGNAVGTAISPTGYDDNIAHLSGFAADQWIEGVFYRAAGTDPSLEVELLLRFQITTNNARGYEVLTNARGGNAIVRWNGGLGSFNELPTTGGGTGALTNGDVLRAEIQGSTIVLKKNGVQVLSATDPTWKDGNPGVGIFYRGGLGTDPLGSAGWASITASDF